MRKKIILCLLVFLSLFFIAQSVLAQDSTSCGEGIQGEIDCGKNSIFNTPLAKFTLPVILGAGAIDGINPCAIGMMILLLGYLIIFAKKQDQVWKIGGIYIITVFLTYFSIGLIFYKFISVLVSQSYYHDISRIIRYVLGVLIIVAGLINIKDFFWYGKGFSLEIPQKHRMKLTKFVEKASISAAFVLGIIVTLFELPCSLPLYVGSIGLLYENLGRTKVILYLLIYNLMFVMPLLAIYIMTLFGKRIVELKEWQEKRQREMKLGMGIVLEILGILLFLIK